MVYLKKKPSRPPKNLLSKGERFKNALIVAKTMIARGSNVEDIVKITGLSETEIKKYAGLSITEFSKLKQIQLKLI